MLNDHLGDALWKVGREREARFQWDQALTLEPEADEVEKIKKKLTEGLPGSVEVGATPEADEEAQRDQAQPAARRVAGGHDWLGRARA